MARGCCASLCVVILFFPATSASATLAPFHLGLAEKRWNPCTVHRSVSTRPRKCKLFADAKTETRVSRFYSRMQRNCNETAPKDGQIFLDQRCMEHKHNLLLISRETYFFQIQAHHYLSNRNL